jgi:putative flippase GtrA
MIASIRRWCSSFQEKHPELSKFAMFFLLSNGVTVLQLALMPLFRWGFDSFTGLVDVDFRWLPIGANVDGSQYYMFDYAAGPLPAGGGGLAYFLAVQITLLIAQVLNFFAQRNITFKSNTSIWRAAFWYAVAYVVITFIAAAAQGFYKAPIYELLIDTWGWGATGETTADVVTMIINAAISFWVFYPIFKVIFRQVPETADAEADAAAAEPARGPRES